MWYQSLARDGSRDGTAAVSDELPFYYVEEQRGMYVILRRVGNHEKVLERYFSETIAGSVAMTLQSSMNADRRLKGEQA